MYTNKEGKNNKFKLNHQIKKIEPNETIRLKKFISTELL